MTLSLFLTGCSLFPQQPKPIEVRSTPVEKPTLTLPSADELNLRGVEWVILTPENFDEQVAKITCLVMKILVL